MKIILFGASGMVGAGVLQVLLQDQETSAVLSVGRRPCGVRHAKLREIQLADLFELETAQAELSGYDACIWAVGVSSVGLDEAAYALLTEELTLRWARALLERNPGLSFCYCSAAGAGGGSMWARVRQRVEGALAAMPFRHVGMVRPAFISPAPGIRSRTALYQAGIVALRPVFPICLRLFPALFTSSHILGRAMVRVVQGRATQTVLESRDINRLGA